MKRNTLILIAAATLILLALGCRKNPNAIIQLPSEPEFVGQYLETQDVLRIGHALNTAPTRQTIQWANPNTDYQYSMMVFTTDSIKSTTSRKFTILAIAPDNDAEVLNLIGTSSEKNIWNIVAETPASPVGKASRMKLTDSPIPEASLASGTSFGGFIVQE